MFSYIGSKFNGTEGSNAWNAENGILHIGAHATAGGVLSVLQGGKFGHGFVSAGVSKALTPSISKVQTGLSVGSKDLGQALIAGTVGGTVSKMTGGKFSNGAITAAFANLFNQQGDHEDAEEELSHNYQLETVICSRSSSVCTADNVWNSVKNNSVPFQDGTLTDGTANKIPLIGTVVTRVDDANYTLTNVTRGDHLFRHGTVTRSLVVSEATISVRTVGAGTNINRAVWAANYMAAPYFKGLDSNIQINIKYQQLQNNFRELRNHVRDFFN